jgi:hypothetical protein
MPNFTWLNDEIVHSAEDTARATAIARKITFLEGEREQRSFQLEYNRETELPYDPYEDCECAACIAAKEFGCDGCLERLGDLAQADAREAERDLDLELLRDKLERIGARMMRAYEHWNEDESYMRMMEGE